MNKKPRQSTFDEHNMPSSKSVSFSPLASVDIIMSIHDYTDEEIQACWYTFDEVSEIRRHNRHIVDIHRAAAVDQSVERLLDSEHFCERGLEHCFPSYTRRENCKRHAIRLVMQEQYFAEINSSCDGTDEDKEAWEAAMRQLAHNYKRASHANKVAAMIRGFNDARAAKLASEQLMPVVRSALQEATAIVENSKEAAPKSSLAPSFSTKSCNFLRQLATRCRQVYSAAA
jgi:hypothetical protein